MLYDGLLGGGVGSEEGFDGKTREGRIKKRRRLNAGFVRGAPAEFGSGVGFLGQSGDAEGWKHGSGISGVVSVGRRVQGNGRSGSLIEAVKGHRIVREDFDRVGCGEARLGQGRENEVRKDSHEEVQDT